VGDYKRPFDDIVLDKSIDPLPARMLTKKSPAPCDAGAMNNSILIFSLKKNQTTATTLSDLFCFYLFIKKKRYSVGTTVRSN